VTRLAYLGRLSICCKDSHTSVGYQCVAKRVIQGDAVGIPRSASMSEESHTG
jgi:hypothetical protein